MIVWGLVLHSLTIAVLFGGLGVSADFARRIAAWKEIALAILLIAVVIRAASHRRSRVTVVGSDMVVAGLIVTAFCYLVATNPIFQAHLPPTSQFLGFRDAALFLFVY